MLAIQGSREMAYTKNKNPSKTIAEKLGNKFSINTSADDDIDWEESIESKYNPITNYNNNKKIKQTN